EPGLLVGVELLAGLRRVLHAGGAVDAGRDGLDLLPQARLARVQEVEVAGLLGGFGDRLGQLGRTPAAAATSRMASCSEGWSVGNALTATTGDTPCSRTFSICLRRLAAPASTSSGFSASRSSGSGLPATILYLPECAFSALTVATTTAASGRRPDARDLILKN